MDRRGLAETVGATLVSSGLALAGLWLFAGRIDWVLVAGLAAGVALATAANYRARTGHADRVAAEAPEADAALDETGAGDGAGEETERDRVGR